MDQIDSLNKIKIYISDIFKIVILLGLSFSSLNYLISSFLSTYFLEDKTSIIFFQIITLFIPFVILNQILDAIIRGIKDVKLYSTFNVIISILSLSLGIFLIINYNIKGAFLSLCINFFIASSILLILLKKKKLIPPLRLVFSFKISNFYELKKTLKIGIAFLISTVSIQIGLLIIRKITLDNFGLYGNGILQSVFLISFNYFNIIFNIIIIYLFPKIVEIKEKIAINDFIRTNLRYIVILMVIAILLFYSFKKWFVVILFSSEFLPAVDLLTFQLLGDYCKSISWVFALWLIPNKKLKLYVFLELFFPFIFIALYYLLINYYSYDVASCSIAYFIANFLTMTLQFFFFKREFYFKFDKILVKTFIISIASFLFVFIVDFFDSNLNQYLIFPILSVIVLLFLTGDEKSKLKSYLKN